MITGSKITVTIVIEPTSVQEAQEASGAQLQAEAKENGLEGLVEALRMRMDDVDDKLLKILEYI